VDKFCYLGDMLSVDEDADAAVETRMLFGCNKFRQLLPLLTNEDTSLIVRGRLYSSCVRSSMLHGSEIWPVRKKNEVKQWQYNGWAKKCIEYKVEGARPKGR